MTDFELLQHITNKKDRFIVKYHSYIEIWSLLIVILVLAAYPILPCVGYIFFVTPILCYVVLYFVRLYMYNRITDIKYKLALNKEDIENVKDRSISKIDSIISDYIDNRINSSDMGQSLFFETHTYSDITCDKFILKVDEHKHIKSLFYRTNKPIEELALNLYRNNWEESDIIKHYDIVKMYHKNNVICTLAEYSKAVIVQFYKI